jgi:ABC-type transport system involved in multi-copper enzyme maturation permease subunit
MHITALTSTGQRTQAIQRPHPLLSVIAWELRRFCASRLFWLQALGFFFFLLFVIWASKMPEQFGRPTMPGHEALSGFVAGTSAWGLLQTLPTSSLLLLILLLPFVTADGVARDLQRRTHELLMATALPTRSYVWGRYLTGLLISLGLAGLLLAAILGIGLLLHLTIPEYPLPPIDVVLLFWVGMVLPATVLVSSLGFALGTLLPRLTAMVKIVILVGWIIGAVVIPIGLGNTAPPTWYVNWDPTSAVTARGLLSAYSINLSTVIRATQLQPVLLTIENKMPDIAGWFVPHLILVGLGLLLVVPAAFTFRRFRNTFIG